MVKLLDFQAMRSIVGIQFCCEKQYINEGMWLCYNKNLLVTVGGKPDLAQVHGLPTLAFTGLLLEFLYTLYIKCTYKN